MPSRSDLRCPDIASELLSIAKRTEALLLKQRWLPEGSDPESQLLRDAQAVIAKAEGRS